MGGSRFVSDAEFQKAVDSQYWVQDTWIEDYVERKITFLSDEAVEKLLTAEEERILKSINQLDERAAQYARLSQMCVLHGKTFAERGKGFLGKAALCILGYGGHKDTLLFETLEIIEACQKAGVGPTGRWLRDIAAMIAAVNEFTDGDETRHLTKEFAGTIQAVEPSLFPAYYDHLCKNEEWENAEGSFSNFLQHTNLSDFIVRAIARTTIDEGGLAELKKRADAGEPEAQSIFTEQERVLGNITFKKDLNNKNEHPTAKSPLFSGWSIAPAAFRLRPHPTPRWKASWLHRGIWIPAPYLIETPNKLICTEAALELWSETRRIAFWQVWPDYLRERWYQNIPPGIGECLFIDAERLKEFCETVKAAFCWAVRVTLHYRQYSYDRFKTYVDTRTFGTSSILR